MLRRLGILAVVQKMDICMQKVFDIVASMHDCLHETPVMRMNIFAYLQTSERFLNQYFLDTHH